MAITEWDKYLANNGITSDMYNKYNNDEKLGLQSAFGKPLPVGQIDSGYSLQGGMGWLGNNKDALGAGAGLAGMGLEAYSTFFGQGKKAFDKNMTLLDQQIASNEEKLARRSALNNAWANTEKSQPKPLGLAASGQGYA